MIKLFMLLTVVSVFMTGTAFAATWEVTVYSPVLTNNSEGMARPLPESNSIATNATGTAGALAISDFAFAQDFIHWHAGEINPGPDANSSDQQLTNAFVGANPVDYDPVLMKCGISGTVQGVVLADISSSLNTVGSPLCVYGIDIISQTTTSIAGHVYVGIPNSIAIGMYYSYAEAFDWTATIQTVPIPGAAWLLFSGLFGIIGLRRKS